MEVATLLSVALQMSLDALVKNLQKSITCRRECERLKLAIERHRPQLVRLAKELDKREQNGQVLDALVELCTDMEALLAKANEIVHEFNSGGKFYNKVFSAKLAKRIEEIRTLIEEKLLHTTVLETILATNPLHQGHCPAATNLQHCHCPAANTLQCCHCLRRTTFPGASQQHGSSMPHLQTVHADPLSHHSASDFSGTSHLRHTRSEEVFSNVAHDSCYNLPVLDINQWRNDVNRINADEQRTRGELHRRHSTTGIPQYPKSGASGYPIARYFEPETSTHAPSAPPLPTSPPSFPRGPSGSMFSYLGDGPLLRALQKGHKG